jgi:uncharacterized protein (TIGR03083 family)
MIPATLVPLVPLDHRAALAGLQTTFLGLVRRVDPAARVPGCPGWSAADLTAHLTGVHRWAAAMSRTPPDATELPDDTDPPIAADPAREYAAAAAELLSALDEDPHRACLTLRGAGTPADWARRQLHETLVHTWDLADAGGLPRWAPPEVVADAVSEVLDTMQPRQVRLGRMPAPQVEVELLGSRRWTLGSGPSVASVAGPDDELLRLLWRRTTWDRAQLVVDGDVGRAADLLGARLTP